MGQEYHGALLTSPSPGYAPEMQFPENGANPDTERYNGNDNIFTIQNIMSEVAGLPPRLNINRWE